MRNFWDTDDIDFALCDIHGEEVINAIKRNGVLGMNRGNLVSEACAKLFSYPKLQEKYPESATFLGQVFRYMKETGYIIPKE